MTVAVQVDVKLLQRAERVTAITDPSELVNRLLERAIELADAQDRLASAGATMPELVVPPQ